MYDDNSKINALAMTKKRPGKKHSESVFLETIIEKKVLRFNLRNCKGVSFKNTFRRSYQRCSLKKGVFKKFQKIHMKTPAPEGLFLIKLQGSSLQVY